MKYTKGPWKIRQNPHSGIVFVANYPIFKECGGHEQTEIEWNDAYLIAAAPTMDTAIRSMLININLALKSGCDGYLRLAIEAGESALKKADGREENKSKCDCAECSGIPF